MEETPSVSPESDGDENLDELLPRDENLDKLVEKFPAPAKWYLEDFGTNQSAAPYPS